jgi:hypothetical protein
MSTPIGQQIDTAIGDVVSPKCAVERAAGQQIHLERPHDPLEIARLDAQPGIRIHADQPAMQELDAATRRNALEPRPQILVARRPWKETAHERAVVEPRSSSQHRQASRARA